VKTSDYLIANGWRPSPTIRAEGAWEHEVLSRVPTSFARAAGVYADGLVRFGELCAISVQVVHEQQRNDSERLRWHSFTDPLFGLGSRQRPETV
jgi:hypothetical protein